MEKVTVIARFLDPGPVRGNTVIQAGLANAFCYLVASVHDPNTAVAQRTLIYLETIKATALKAKPNENTNANSININFILFYYF